VKEGRRVSEKKTEEGGVLKNIADRKIVDERRSSLFLYGRISPAGIVVDRTVV
jgi:hypothetical protein